MTLSKKIKSYALISLCITSACKINKGKISAVNKKQAVDKKNG